MNSNGADKGDRDAIYEPPGSGQSGGMSDSSDSDGSNDSNDEDDHGGSGVEEYDNRWRESTSDYKHGDPVSSGRGKRSEEDRSDRIVGVNHGSSVLHESTEKTGGHQFTAALNHHRPLNDKAEDGIYLERSGGSSAPVYETDDDDDGDDGREHEMIEIREKREGDDEGGDDSYDENSGDDGGDHDDSMYDDDDNGIYDDDTYDDDDDSGIDT